MVRCDVLDCIYINFGLYPFYFIVGGKTRTACFDFGLHKCLRNVSIGVRKCSQSVAYKLDLLSACYLDHCSKIEGNNTSIDCYR